MQITMDGQYEPEELEAFFGLLATHAQSMGDEPSQEVYQFTLYPQGDSRRFDMEGELPDGVREVFAFCENDDIMHLSECFWLAPHPDNPERTAVFGTESPTPYFVLGTNGGL